MAVSVGSAARALRRLIRVSASPSLRRPTLSLAVPLLAACGGDEPSRLQRASTAPSGPDPCAVVLSPHRGETREDTAIARLQEEVRGSRDPAPQLERLGWLFVAKARLSYDPGYYRLAEQAAVCMESKQPRSPAALLLRGHVLHNLHRFAEGEKLARRLVALRGLPFDHGLLGDLLMEQGRLDEAAAVYQKMMDLKPGLQSYSRGAHLRWLKGDLKGAMELMRMAAAAGSPRDREAVAWVYSRIAMYELQAGNTAAALKASGDALTLVADYAPALLARGHILMAAGRTAEAIEPLRRAAELNPLPEYQWALADALREEGRLAETRVMEDRLHKKGALEDPRTFALYLATRYLTSGGEQPNEALDLARDELARRADVFTQDAVAWALAAAGQPGQAHARMQLALAQGTQDARLFYHAGAIAGMLGRNDEARQRLEQASRIRQLLLPSERKDLSRRLAAFGNRGERLAQLTTDGEPRAASRSHANRPDRDIIPIGRASSKLNGP
jgi:tetratricopeptide (TPR) repeat protein